MNFITELNNLRLKAESYIDSILDKRGTGYELIDPAEYDEDLSDNIYKLPTALSSGMHGGLHVFRIVIINRKDGVTSFEGINTDGERDEKFKYEDLETSQICAIAQLVFTLEN